MKKHLCSTDDLRRPEAIAARLNEAHDALILAGIGARALHDVAAGPASAALVADLERAVVEADGHVALARYLVGIVDLIGRPPPSAAPASAAVGAVS